MVGLDFSHYTILVGVGWISKLTEKKFSFIEVVIILSHDQLALLRRFVALFKVAQNILSTTLLFGWMLPQVKA